MIDVDVTDTIHDLPVDAIAPCPDNRHDTDVDDLAASIAVIGVQQPIRVRTIEPGRYELIAGERRWRACTQLDLTTIPAIIDDDTDRVSRITKRYAENTGRKDFHALDEGSVFAELRAEGLSQTEIGDRVQKTQPYVSVRLKVHDRLPERAKAAWRAEQLKTKQAEAIADLDDQPDLVDLVLDVAGEIADGRRLEHDLDATISRVEADAKRRRKVAAITDELTNAGVKIHTGSYEGDQVLGATYGVMVDPAAHADETCHRAMVTTNAEVVLLCLNRDRHRPSGDSDLKASNLTDDRADEDSNPIAEFAQQLEDGAHQHDDDGDDHVPTQDEIARAEQAAAERHTRETAATEAAERRRVEIEAAESAAAARLDIAQASIAKTRSQATALTTLRRQIVEDTLVDDFAEQIAAALRLDADFAGDAPGDDIRASIDETNDSPTRFTMAVAFALGESQLRYALNPRADEYMKRAARAHLQWLIDDGYTPTAAERALLEPVQVNITVDASQAVQSLAEAGAAVDDLALGRARMEALTVLGYGDATGAEVRESNTTTPRAELIDPSSEADLTVHAQTARWAIDNALATLDDGALTLTPAGRQMVFDEELLVDFDLPDVPPVAAPPPSAPATDGEEADLVVAAWSAFLAARDAAVQADDRKTGKADAYMALDAARSNLAAAIVTRDPNPLELGTALHAAATAHRETDGGSEQARINAANLIAGEDDRLPDDFRDAIIAGTELRLDARPNTKTLGAIRNLYLNDVLDEIERRHATGALS